MAADDLPAKPVDAASSFPEPIQREAGRLLFGGPLGYRRFQELVAPHITTDESRQADAVIHRAIIVVMWGLAAMLILRVLAWPILSQLMPHPVSFFMVFNDLEAALILFAAVLLSCRFPGTYGSAYLFPVNAMGFFFGMSPGSELTEEAACAAIVWSVIVAYALIGLLFDYAIHLLQRRGNGLATLYLAVSLLLYVGLIVWDKWFPSYGAKEGSAPHFIPWISLPVAVVVVIILARGARNSHGDAPETKGQSLCRWALMRWQIYVAGIVLALTLCIFPFIGFLAFMGLHNRVMEGNADEALSYRDYPGLRLFWYEKGDFMTEKDFQHGEFYFLDKDFWDGSKQNPVRDLVLQLRGHPGDLELYDRVSSSLKDLGNQVTVGTVEGYGGPRDPDDIYRLFNRNEVVEKRNEAGEKEPSAASEYTVPPPSESVQLPLPGALYPEEKAPPETPVAAEKPPEYLLLPTPFKVEPIRYESLKERVNDSYSYQVALIFLGIFGALILWRRGGDSWPARVTGAWLIAIFASLPCNFGEYFVSALSYQCSLLALQPAGYAASNALRILIAVLDATGILVYVFAALGLPTAWLWTYYCWPSRRAPGWRQKLDFFGNFILVWLLCLIFICLPGLVEILNPDEVEAPTTARAICTALLIFGLLFAGISMRRRNAASDLPALGKWPVVAFMFLQLVMLTSACFSAPLRAPLPYFVPNLPVFTVLAVVSGSGLVIWFTSKAHLRLPVFRLGHLERWIVAAVALMFAMGAYVWLSFPAGNTPHADINLALVVAILAAFTTLLTLLRADFLNLQAVDDLSYLLVIFAVPAIMSLIENALDRTLSHIPLLSEDGILVISILLAVSLYPRLHHILGHLCQRFSSPRLHEIEESIEEGIENLVDLGVDSEKQDRLRHLFTALEIHSYALYVRRTDESFGRYISHWPLPPDELVLSEPLQRYLRGRSTFTDLFSVPNLWSSFFHQFEMRRIENLFSQISGAEAPLSCRYLLPICIGKTVCALLILPASIGEMNHQPFAGVLNSLGVAALTHKEMKSGA